jgi:hypothetical protein
VSGEESAHQGHDPLTGAAAAKIDVAVICVAAKAVTASGQLLVEFVEHKVAQEGREHSLNAKGNFRFDRTIVDWCSGFVLDLRLK